MPRRESQSPICPQTGVTIPECSCSRCLEEQIRRFVPDLLAGEVRVVRAPRRRARRRTRDAG